MTDHPVEWHVDEADLATYLAGTSSQVVSASIEAHLMHCPACRARLAHQTGQEDRRRAWNRLAEAIDRPTPSVLDRVTGGRGVTRSAIAIPPMVRAAVVAIGLIVLVPIVTVFLVGQSALITLLIFAPFAPAAAVAIATARDRILLATLRWRRRPRACDWSLRVLWSCRVRRCHSGSARR
jgi:hypothetical protein